jgi:hypothetical protein
MRVLYQIARPPASQPGQRWLGGVVLLVDEETTYSRRNKAQRSAA